MKFLPFQLIILFVSTIVSAETIVRMELQQGSKVENIDLKLFNSAAPETVNSFLKYVDAVPVINLPNTPTESYNNSFINRVDAGILVEGGNFTYTPGGAFSCTDCIDSNNEALFVFPDALQLVTLDPPIIVEFKKSNIRGTISMRKFLGNTSATPVKPGHWFINLTDNSALLDSFNFITEGPYTAFGEVINNTMTTVDGIETNTETTFVDRRDIHFEFNPMPLINYVINDDITQANLVRINSIKKLFSISSDVAAGLITDTDFGISLINSNLQSIVTITNLGIYDLRIIAIAGSDTLNLPFTIDPLNNTCTAAILAPSSDCTFTIQFNSAVEDVFSDTFSIEFGFGDGIGIEKNILNYSYSVSARAVSAIQPFITVSANQMDFGAILTDTTKQSSIYVTNSGSSDLDVSSTILSGDNAAEFQEATNCVSASPIALDKSCEIIITFTPKSVGEKAAVLTISSNDPNQSNVIIPLNGYGDKDTDGITAEIEEAAPNNGDNNSDGQMDSLQGNVASFIGEDGKYLTLIIDSEFYFSNISLIPADQLYDFPEETDFSKGVFSYDVNLNQFGTTIEIGIILPPGIPPEVYYLFGPTVDDNVPHWYEYTAVQLFENVTLTAPSGAQSTRNLIKLAVQDGGTGDADGVVNGKITIGPGAPAYPVSISSDNSSGCLNFIFLTFFAFLLYRSRSYGSCIIC